MEQSLYVMISSTGSGMGKTIQKVTGFPYNHVSLSLDNRLQEWISFARLNISAPLAGGLVEESSGRFATIGKTMPVRIFRIPLSQEEYASLQDFRDGILSDREKLTYNSFDAAASALGLRFPVKGAYTCLAFANAVLHTRFFSISELNDGLSRFLMYEGDFFRLVPPETPPKEAYLTPWGKGRAIVFTVRHFVFLLCRVIAPGRFSDPICTRCDALPPLLSEREATG